MDRFAGIKEGEKFDDMDLLKSVMNTETRIWGFQICKDSQAGHINMFRIELAEDYGTADYFDLSPGGPVVTGCLRYKIADPKVDSISKITVFTDGSIVGMTVIAGGRVGNFGNISVRDSVNFSFTREKPPIGIYGFTGTEFISGLGFITYDLGDECQNFGKADTSSNTDSQDTSTTDGVNDTLIP